MIIFKKPDDLRDYLHEIRIRGKSIGFVPTMGALHEGHLSLLKKAVEESDCVVCSIFVNPTQFNDMVDFEKYPKTPNADLSFLEKSGCQIAFMPEADDMYPSGVEQETHYDFGILGQILEGHHRPGHFNGVGQIMDKMLALIQPDFLFMGQKDFQQCLIIRELLKKTEKSKKTKLIICPTIREPDGLAMSSRNAQLTDPQRALAATIYQCLISIQSKQFVATFPLIQKECEELLLKKGLQPEYVVLADAETGNLLDEFDPEKQMVALIAARIGDVRLIDNLILPKAP